MVGDIGLFFKDSEAEIGFTIDPHFQRRGLAIESVTSLIKYLFQKKIVSKIIAYTDPNNIPSVNLLKKIGFYQNSTNNEDSKTNSGLFFILNHDKN
jgi:ribosomal-protein-alanine N-acetyltransferase